MERNFILFGILFVLLGIILGAFAAHGLETAGLEQAKIDSFKVGVDYLFYSGFGMMILGGLREKFDFLMKLHFRMIFFGTILFSFSIFLLAISPLIHLEASKFIGPITPFGGSLMIIGWFTLFIKYLRQVGG
jgi:uncharacterized membrane protein YgdD (TMEM256/DUF423 family)